MHHSSCLVHEAGSVGHVVSEPHVEHARALLSDGWEGRRGEGSFHFMGNVIEFTLSTQHQCSPLMP